jgi:hypothetical protein
MINDKFVNEIVSDVENFIESRKELERSYNKFSMFWWCGFNNAIEVDDKIDNYNEKLIILKSKYIKVNSNKTTPKYIESQEYPLAIENNYPFAEDNNKTPIPSAPPMNQ